MPATLETKACSACASAKRRCGKQTPHCLRCRTRGIRCSYPATKPSNFILLAENNAQFVEFDLSSSSTLQISRSPQQIGVTNKSGISLDVSTLPTTPLDDQLVSHWFSSLETWTIRYPPAVQNSTAVADVKRFARTVQRWLAEWVEKGSNPFIHARLYHSRFPRCVQNAMAALTCYLHKTPANEETVFRTIEDNVKELLAGNGILASPRGDGVDSNQSSPLDPLENLARVHALLAYQTIGLFDGDIRLRYLAESHIPILNAWMRSMVSSSSEAKACLGGSVVVGAADQTTVGVNSLASAASNPNHLWHAWILAESVRRTFIIGSGVFFALQQREIVPCQGGMMFTTRAGVWEAGTAMQWENICADVNVGLMQMADVGRLFVEQVPGMIDEFAKVVMEVNFGRERMERWGIEVGD